MAQRDWDIDLLPPDRLQWSDVVVPLGTYDGYPPCPVHGCWESAEIETFDGPRCRNHGDVIEPDPFALDAMSHS